MRRSGAILFLILLAIAARELKLGESREIAATNSAQVHVIDGDSLKIGTEEIRIAGIDAPEYRQLCGDGSGGEWACGKAARDALAALVAAGDLRCTERARDRYGRALSDCRIRSGDVATALARAGFAESAGDARFDPHEQEIAEARAARRGIWRGPHLHPADWRRAQRPGP
ncbi:MAG: thermonuclease family protein [Proteobacteria bacterium]|nr:thermonuclease family protein [Pseudomonadota bacterium]